MSEARFRDIFVRYRYGIAQLLERLGKDHPQYDEALVYQQRLVENLALAELHGNPESSQTERSVILAALNTLSLATLETSFNALCGLDELESDVVAPQSAEPPPGIKVEGDGTTIGDHNVVNIAKDGGAINLTLPVEAAETFIQWYELRGRSDEEIKAQVLRLAMTAHDNPAIPQHCRARAAEAVVKVGNLTLAQIRVDKELLAVLGLFLIGDLAKTMIDALRDDRDVPVSPPPSGPSEPPPQPHKRPKLTRLCDFEPELVFVPAGEFLMGTTAHQAAALRREFGEKSWYKFDWETPQNTLYLPDYYIGKYPVTNAQYRAFVQATGHRAPHHWENGRIPHGKEEHPVSWLYWKDAVDYCNWLADVTGQPYRLPSEAEWEKAARGTDGRIYPWGNTWDLARCNHWKSGVHDTTPVGQYSPQGDSPCDCADMAGNVWEWTSSLYKPYPYQKDDGHEVMEFSPFRVSRGGSFYCDQDDARCANRSGPDPTDVDSIFGFRVMVSLSRT